MGQNIDNESVELGQGLLMNQILETNAFANPKEYYDVSSIEIKNFY